MSNAINSPGYIDRSVASTLLEKWKPMLDYTSNTIKPIEDDHMRLATAVVMENQQKYLREANLASTGNVFGTHHGGGQGGNVGNSDFYAQGDARLPKVIIPMIRRTFPELITNEIVGVQPMSGPVGLAFALRYKYDAQNLNYATNGGDGWSTPQYPNPNSGAQSSNGQEIGWQYLNTAYTGVTSSRLSGLGPSDTIMPFATGDMGVAALISQFEMSGRIPQMTIQFEKTAVEAGTRRLAAKWSVELEQDLKNMNGIDIDNELTNAMSYEIQAEIDREMIIRMIQICLNGGYSSPSKLGGYSFWYAGSADARWLGERSRDFYARCIVEANRIAIRNRRGAANFIVATPRVCAMLEMLPEFKFMPMNGTVNTQPTGIAKVGSVGGRFNIYRDTRTEAQYQVGQRTSMVEYALLGYKGSEYYDTGIVYCPYIPVMIQRTIGPNDFAPRVGLLTRYAVIDHLFGADLYYHLIIVKGLGDAFVPGAAHVYL